MAKDLYEVLGVSRDASHEHIRKTYRILAQTWHPDKEGGDEVRFKEIGEAYDVLGNPEKRKLYDAGELEVKPERKAAMEAILELINRFCDEDANLIFKIHYEIAAAKRTIQSNHDKAINKLSKGKARMEKLNFGDNTLFKQAMERHVQNLEAALKKEEFGMAVIKEIEGIIKDVKDEGIYSGRAAPFKPDSLDALFLQAMGINAGGNPFA